MKRKCFAETAIPIMSQELRNRTAFHEAGHAAAIYLLNKLKKLPPVFFQISIKEMDQTNAWPIAYEAQVEDGRLIQSLPVSAPSAPATPEKATEGLLTAFEADVVNLLVGSLAEAKYVACRDGETINPHSINIEALKFYGGSADLKVVHEYMDSFIPWEHTRKLKIKELFYQAFNFIDEHSNWKAISALAKYILDNRTTVITCEKAISILDAA